MLSCSLWNYCLLIYLSEFIEIIVRVCLVWWCWFLVVSNWWKMWFMMFLFCLVDIWRYIVIWWFMCLVWFVMLWLMFCENGNELIVFDVWFLMVCCFYRKCDLKLIVLYLIVNEMKFWDEWLSIFLLCNVS